MKKIMNWVMAATLVCSASVFTSCSSKDDDNGSQTASGLAEKMVGKWLYIESDGEKVETSESSITNFVMEGFTLKAYTSISLKDYGLWAYKQPTDVTFDGNDVTLTMHSGDFTTVEKMTDIAVFGDNMYYTSMYTLSRNGEVLTSMGPYRLHCTRVYIDFAPVIIGKWEGTITSDEPGFVPQPFCEAYLADGTNIAYNLIDGKWVQEVSEYDEYFVDGNLMCTRWKVSGRDEERQNCIIDSYANGILLIKEVVLRNAKLYTETTTLTKVKD